MALSPVLTSTVAGSLFTSQPPFSIAVSQAAIQNALNPLLVQTELNQPEGTPLQLQITNLSNASTLAQQLNQQYQAGKLQDNATGEPLQAWSGYSTVAQAQGTTLYLRWVKGQPFAVVLIWAMVIIAAAIAVFLIVRELMGSSWSLSKAIGVTPQTSTTAGPPLGIPWWEWIGGGLITLIGLPFVFRETTNLITSYRTLKRTERHG